jgi:hypothetical protein
MVEPCASGSAEPPQNGRYTWKWLPGAVGSILGRWEIDRVPANRRELPRIHRIRHAFSQPFHSNSPGALGERSYNTTMRACAAGGHSLTRLRRSQLVVA